MLSRAMRSDFDRRVGTHGITRSQWTVLAVVAGIPGASQKTIAELTDVSEAAAGRTIDRLCGECLLERRERADDRRAREIFLTPAAERMLETVGTLASESEKDVFAGLSDAELEALLSSLDKIYRNLGGGALPQATSGNRGDQEKGGVRPDAALIKVRAGRKSPRSA